MPLDDVFHDAQADADSLRFATEFRTSPVKALEDAFVLVGRDASAVVLNP